MTIDPRDVELLAEAFDKAVDHGTPLSQAPKLVDEYLAKRGAPAWLRTLGQAQVRFIVRCVRLRI
jgi:hypothetical protein